MSNLLKPRRWSVKDIQANATVPNIQLTININI